MLDLNGKLVLVHLRFLKTNDNGFKEIDSQ